MLHCLIVCPVRRKHHSCLVVPVDSLEPGSVNAFHLLEMSVYSPPFQGDTKWTHLILFPRFSLNLFSYIIKSSPIFLTQRGPLQPVSGMTLMTADWFEYFLLFFSPPPCLFSVSYFHSVNAHAVRWGPIQNPSPLIFLALNRYFACEI